MGRYGSTNKGKVNKKKRLLDGVICSITFAKGWPKRQCGLGTTRRGLWGWPAFIALLLRTQNRPVFLSRGERRGRKKHCGVYVAVVAVAALAGNTIVCQLRTSRGCRCRERDPTQGWSVSCWLVGFDIKNAKGRGVYCAFKLIDELPRTLHFPHLLLRGLFLSSPNEDRRKRSHGEFYKSPCLPCSFRS